MLTVRQHLLHRLNSYRGDNPWQDVIAQFEDTEATDLIDQGRNDRFVGIDGFTYRYDHQRGVWT